VISVSDKNKNVSRSWKWLFVLLAVVALGSLASQAMQIGVETRTRTVSIVSLTTQTQTVAKEIIIQGVDTYRPYQQVTITGKFVMSYDVSRNAHRMFLVVSNVSALKLAIDTLTEFCYGCVPLSYIRLSGCSPTFQIRDGDVITVTGTLVPGGTIYVQSIVDAGVTSC